MIINRYLTREVMSAMMAITLILMLAFLSQQVVRYLNYVAIGKIPTNVLLELVSFEIPYLLAFLLPLGLFIGVLLVYGRLHVDHEMVVLQMYGFNNRRIMKLTLLMAASIACIVLCLMMWINPMISAKRQHVMKDDESALHRMQTLTPGRFQASADGRHVMYVEKLSRDHERAETVFIAERKIEKGAKSVDPKSWSLILADQGYQMHDRASSDQFFVTTNGYRYEGVPGRNDYKIIQFGKYALRTPQSGMHLSHLEVEALPTLQLLQEYANPKRAAEFQWRLSVAITVLFLALVALPLSTVKPRRSRYWILLPALLIYIVYINLLFVARHWVEQNLIPISLGVWWVHGMMLLFILAMFLYHRQGFKQ